jgi:hypothetical protein
MRIGILLSSKQFLLFPSIGYRIAASIRRSGTIKGVCINATAASHPAKIAGHSHQAGNFQPASGQLSGHNKMYRELLAAQFGFFFVAFAHFFT